MTRLHKCIRTGLILFIFAFQACNGDKQSNSTISLYGNLPSPLIDTLKQIGQQVQYRQIDPTKDTVIMGDNGTRLFISANSLVNDQGVQITDKVILELKENYSIADIVMSNLQTVSGNSILQTQGMIYFNAISSDGTNVKIDKSKPIRIEFPVKEKIEAAKIFKGQRDRDGNISWEEISEPSKLLVPFPIRTLEPIGLGECYKDFGITSDLKLWNKEKANLYMTFDTLSKYENTLLATREFKERYYSFCSPKLTKAYINNLDKNMWEVDEMLVENFIKDSAEGVDIFINNPPPIANGVSVTKEQKEAHQWLIDHAKEDGHRRIELFKKFASQKLTKVDASKRVDTALIKEANTAFVAYDALEFGWVNVDFFYNDPQAENLKLITKTNDDASIVNLILPDRNIILPGILKGDKTYWFTKQEDGYNKLPKGEKAIIICIGFKNNKLTFADKEIIIGQNETESLYLIESSGDMIKARLMDYGK